MPWFSHFGHTQPSRSRLGSSRAGGGLLWGAVLATAAPALLTMVAVLTVFELIAGGAVWAEAARGRASSPGRGRLVGLGVGRQQEPANGIGRPVRPTPTFCGFVPVYGIN